jgi:hypothetical protein|tara:strand:+ start:11014 stop:11325 length:312 start_codon:yes stop_codon:yes gene_type:complete
MIKLVEVKKIKDYDITEGFGAIDNHYELDEIWINPDSILQIRGDSAMRKNLDKGYLPKNLDTQLEFSRIQFGSGNNVSAVTVVGSPPVLAEKIFSTNKQLLKG